MPASGGSGAPYCTISFAANPISAGSNTNLSFSVYQGSGDSVSNQTVTRSGTTICTGTGTCDAQSSELSEGTHTYNGSARIGTYGWSGGKNGQYGWTYSTVTCSADLEVGEAVDPPTATIEVRNITEDDDWTGGDITIDSDDEVELRWSSTNANSCSGTNFSTGGATSGDTTSVTEPSGGNTTQYTVTCVGDGGSANDWLSVTNVGNGPEIEVDPPIVTPGEEVELEWDINDGTNCVLTGPGVDETLETATGTITVTIYNESTFTITCDDGLSDQATVEVLPVIQET